MAIVKKLFKACLLCVIFIFIFSGCQKTPDDAAVQQKNNEQLLSQIQETNNHESNILPAVNNIEDSFEENDLSVFINADVITPDTPINVVEVEKVGISEQQAKNILNALIGERTLYAANQTTQDDVLRELTEWQKIVEDEQNSEEKINSAKQKINELQNHLLSGNIASEANEISRSYQRPRFDYSEDELNEFTGEELDNAMKMNELQNNARENPDAINLDYEEIRGIVHWSDKQTANINIANYDIEKGSYVYFQKNAPIDYDPNYENPIGVSFSEAEAIHMAEQLLLDMGILHLSVAKSTKAEPNGKYTDLGVTGEEYYNIYFTPTVSGIDSNYVDEYFLQALAIEDDQISFSEFWAQEFAEVVVDNNGFNRFRWYEPSTTGDVINADVSQKPFDEIIDIFKQQIKNKAIYDSDSIKREIHVDEIRLGLMQMKLPEGDAYAYVPVWDFYGYTNNTYPPDTELIVDENGKAIQRNFGESFLTINAVDGSIVDRLRGY